MDERRQEVALPDLLSRETENKLGGVRKKTEAPSRPPSEIACVP